MNESISLPGAWEDLSCGLTFECECVIEAKAITVHGLVEWDTAPPAACGEPGAVVPDKDVRRSTQKIEFDQLARTPGQPVIAGVRASNARAGTPWHGRWHVLVLLAR